MPIRRRQKKPNAEPRQKPNHSHAVVDPMVDPGSPPHRRQARAKADTTRTHHRMVTLAQSSSGGRSASPPQNQTATVMLGSTPVRAKERARFEKVEQVLADNRGILLAIPGVIGVRPGYR